MNFHVRYEKVYERKQHVEAQENCEEDKYGLSPLYVQQSDIDILQIQDPFLLDAFKDKVGEKIKYALYGYKVLF